MMVVRIHRTNEGLPIEGGMIAARFGGRIFQVFRLVVAPVR